MQHIPYFIVVIFSDADGVFGCVPQSVIDDEQENITSWDTKTDIVSFLHLFDEDCKH